LHIELRQQEEFQSGMTAYDAQAAARRRFGNTMYLKEESHIAWGWEWLENVAQDVRYGLRTLRKSPGFTAVAILTLAVGIAVNTTVFTAFDALFLRPRPVKVLICLSSIFRTTPGAPRSGFSYPHYLYYSDNSSAFSDLSLFAFGMAVTSSDLPATSPGVVPRVAGAGHDSRTRGRQI